MHPSTGKFFNQSKHNFQQTQNMKVGELDDKFKDSEHYKRSGKKWKGSYLKLEFILRYTQDTHKQPNISSHQEIRSEASSE